MGLARLGGERHHGEHAWIGLSRGHWFFASNAVYSKSIAAAVVLRKWVDTTGLPSLRIRSSRLLLIEKM